MATFVRGNQLLFMAKMLFTFSTIYTLAYFWTLGEGSTINAPELGEQAAENVVTTQSSWITGITQGLIDDILDLVSYFSPFALVKFLLKTITPDDIYIILNLLLLRPIGWIGAFITSEWVINKIRGVSE